MPSSSNNFTKNPELEALIKDVKFKIRKFYGGIKGQIQRTGNFLKEKKLVKERDICIEIKSYLKEEIEEGLISERTVDRCCPDEWKRKTRPKGERQMSFFEDKKEPESETVTNTNISLTPESQALQQEFEPVNEPNIVKEQKPEGTKIQRVVQIPGEQESEEMQRLKMENKGQNEKIESLLKEIDKLKEEGDVWTANGIVQVGKIQLPLIITVNTKQKKIESVELDREAIRTLKIS